MTGTTNSVMKVAYSRPPATTSAIPRSIEAPISVEKMSAHIEMMVVSAVARMGRIRVRPQAMSAARFAMPPRRSWLA